jgi:hypothetical protein
MQARMVQRGTAIAAVLLAIIVARAEAFAASDHESCSTRSTDVNHRNPDGTEAICQAASTGGPPNRASAYASDQGVAGSSTYNGSEAKSFASGVGAAATAGAQDGGNATATASGENAQAGALAESGATKATAKGKDSEAEAAIEWTDGGKTTATATGGSKATALIRSAGGGNALATAKEAAEAFAIASGGGKATSVSSGSGSSAVAGAVNGSVAKATASDGAQAGADAGATTPGRQLAPDSTAAKCKATATGSGAGSNAAAACENAGSVVTAVATKGSTAIGSDTSAPTCTTVNGGVAKVRSPMGDCD